MNLLKMRKNRKAAIELSVTAIVILILAIVILGLGLGFVRGMFGKASTMFEQQIAVEPEPSPPSSSEPLTLSRERLIVHSGDAIALKFGVYNSGNKPWSKVNVTIDCSGAGTTAMPDNEQVNSKALNSGESFLGTYLFVVGNIDEGTYLCEAKVGHVPKPGPNATKDLVINVRK
ncbi:hypothetical protein KY366_04600 [Candidatus Woesearchaeota archaeon]|nr:hypothetical protein [Candidatus Woesearchaeota archaeon]